MQALNFALEGVQQFSPGKERALLSNGENVTLYLEPWKGHHSKSIGHHGSCCGCQGGFRGLIMANLLNRAYWLPAFRNLIKE